MRELLVELGLDHRDAVAVQSTAETPVTCGFPAPDGSERPDGSRHPAHDATGIPQRERLLLDL